MGDTISSFTKKIFYVIKRKAAAYVTVSYINGQSSRGGFEFGSSVESAVHYASVQEVLEAFQRRGNGRFNLDLPGEAFTIVRVEETPGSEERVVLGETQEAPAGSVVKYALAGFGEFAIDLTIPMFKEGRWTRKLTDARLFAGQEDAIRALLNNSYAEQVVPIVRVAVQPSAPKYTETVLA